MGRETAFGPSFQKRITRLFLDNKQLPCVLVSLSILSIVVLGTYFYAAQKRDSFNESLGVMFSEVVSLQELLENEKAETQKIAADLDAVADQLRTKQAEIQSQLDLLRRNEAIIADLNNGLNIAPTDSPSPPDWENFQKNSSPSFNNPQIDHIRRNAVREEFIFAWESYKQYAWGKDEVKPVSKSNTNWLDLAVTMVDALDTLWIMDLHSEFNLAREWIADNLTFDKNRDSSLFETTIRELGGLLSAYELSKDKMFLDKAEDLGQRLLRGFSDPSGIPHAAINLATGSATSPSWIRNLSILSEIGTLQLEFLYLAYHTNNPEYAIKPLNVFRHLDSLEKTDGLYPLYINRQSGTFSGSEISFGALGDSFYEYQLKLWLFTNKEADGYRRMYEESSTGAINRLVQTSKSGYRYLAQIGKSGSISTKMEHLACFAGGMFALGAQNNAAEGASEEHISVAADLTESCHESYDRTQTKLGPETFEFSSSDEFIVPARSRYYILRPEVVESYFVLWRTTHDPKYREWAWEAFEAIKHICKVEGGYSGIHDVDKYPPTHDDTQQSFFLAETLKYLYLIFSEDSLIPLDKYVFNTEAHPLGIPQESIYSWPQELQFQLLVS